MTLWLLDANVLSELRRQKPDRAVLDFVAAQRLTTLHISAVTIAEIRFGITRETDSVRRDTLKGWLEHEIRPMFEDRVVPLDEEVMLRCRTLVGDGRREKEAYAQPDLFIAATALHHGMIIASRDKKGFAATGVSVFNPWKNTGGGRVPS